VGLQVDECPVRTIIVLPVHGVFDAAHSGTPAQIARGTDDISMLNLDDYRSRRKNTPGDQSMRRSIQDLVASVDPNVKIEPEVEDVRPSYSFDEDFS
jgi:hypothetical protein